MLREQTTRVGLDKARSSKRQLEQRARKLINRIRGQHEYDTEKHLSYVVSETFWWEQLVLFKTELKRSNHSIIMFQHVDPDYLDVCTEISHTFCNQDDFIARLSSARVAFMFSEKRRSRRVNLLSSRQSLVSCKSKRSKPSLHRIMR